MAVLPVTEAPLIRTKLRVPSLPANFQSRRRITDRIERGVGRAVLLLTAPAGFGKSTSVLDWSMTQRPSVPMAWLSLDAYDNTPDRFWGHVLAALQDCDGAIGAESGEWLPETTEGDPLLFIGSLLNELVESETDIRLVLDDLHLIENEKLLGQIDYLIHHLPPTLGLIMTSRIDPGLALHRLRASGDLVEVRADELRMNTDEIAAFVGTQVDEVDHRIVRDLERRTGGWPVAVQLLTVRLSQSGDAARYLAESVDEMRPVVDYMVAEILDNLPTELRTFVLETSVLNGFTAELCDELRQADDSYPLIRELIEQCLFVTESAGDDQWFRFHQLFTDIVESELRYRDRRRWTDLHRRAAVMMEGRGELDQALDHACSGEDWEFLASHALEAALRFANHGQFHRYRHWLLALPDAYIERDAVTIVLVGLAHAMSWNFDEAERHLEKAVAANETISEQRPSLTALAFLAYVSGNRDPVERWHERARDAAAAVPDDDDTVGALRTQSMASAQLATASFYCGDLEGARTAAERAITVGARIDFPSPRGLAFGALALTEVMTGDLPSCKVALDQMSSIIQGTDMELVAHGIVRDEVRGRLAFELDDLDDAHHHLDRAWNAVRTRPAARPGIGAGLARTLAATGNRAAARSWLERATGELAAAGRHPAAELEIALAELAIVTGDGDRSGSADLGRRLAYLGRQLSGDLAIVADVAAKRAERLGGATSLRAVMDLTPVGPRAALELHLLNAVEAGDEAMGRAAVVAALDIVQANGLVRVLRGWGDEIVEIIGRLAADHIGARSVLEPEATPRRTTAANDRLLDPLSASELRVLAELTSGDSYQEIADRRFVSHNTIKSHVKAVYRKLGVHSRVAAVARAGELGLIESPGRSGESPSP